MGGNSGSADLTLFPRSNWLEQTLLNATFAAWKGSIDAGLFTINFKFASTLAAGGHPDNSVNPAWRETVVHSIQIASWSSGATFEEIKLQRDLLTKRQKAWIEVSPGAGAYLGESDREEVAAEVLWE